MPGGRPRKPHALRVLEGGRGKSRPLTPDLPAPRDPLVTPKGLTREEAQEWKRHAEWLRALKLESRVDAGQFLGMIRHYCRALLADRAIARHGLTMKTQANGTVRRPEVLISKESWAAYATLADKFGFSAAARAKLGAKATPPVKAGDVPEDLAGE